MEIDFISRGQLILAGMSFYGDPFKDAGDWSAENEIGRLCKRFMDFNECHRAEMAALKSGDDFYEVHIYNDETEAKGFFEVFVGCALDRVNQPPLELSLKILPAGHYAAIALKGEQIISDWYRDLDAELAQKGWQRSSPYFFQVYDQRYRGLERIAESELTAFIPVKPASNTHLDG